MTHSASPLAQRRARAFSRWEVGLAGRMLRAARADRGVALLTALATGSTALATAALIIVMSVMGGFRTELLERMVGLSGHLFVASPELTGPERDAALARLRRIPGVAGVTAVIEAPVMTVGPSAIKAGVIRAGSTLGFRGRFAPRVVAGDAEGVERSEPGGPVLLGAALARSLGLRVGDQLTVLAARAAEGGDTPERRAFTVGGLIETGLSDYDQALVWMSLPDAQALLNREGEVDQVEVALRDADDLPRVRAAVAQAAGPQARLSDWSERNGSFLAVLDLQKRVMALILSLIIGIAAINITSGLIMLVKTKRGDIAVLRTIGAEQGAVVRIFLLCGLTVGLAGCTAGAAAGWLFCVFISPIQSAVERLTGVPVFDPGTYHLTRIPARVEPLEVAGVLLFALLMSLAATLPPAWSAGRLDPVEALRDA